MDDGLSLRLDDGLLLRWDDGSLCMEELSVWPSCGSDDSDFPR